MFGMTLLPSGIDDKLSEVRNTLQNNPPATDNQFTAVKDDVGEVVESLEKYDRAGLDVVLQLKQARNAFDTLDTAHAFHLNDPEERAELVQDALDTATKLDVPYTDKHVQDCLSAAQDELMANEGRRMMDALDESEEN